MTQQEDKAIRAAGQVIGMLAVLGIPAIQAAPHLTQAFQEMLTEAMDSLGELCDSDGNLVTSYDALPALEKEGGKP